VTNLLHVRYERSFRFSSLEPAHAYPVVIPDSPSRTAAQKRADAVILGLVLLIFVLLVLWFLFPPRLAGPAGAVMDHARRLVFGQNGGVGGPRLGVGRAGEETGRRPSGGEDDRAAASEPLARENSGGRNAETADGAVHPAHPVAQPSNAALANPDLPERSIGRLPSSGPRPDEASPRAGAAGADPRERPVGNDPGAAEAEARPLSSTGDTLTDRTNAPPDQPVTNPFTRPARATLARTNIAVLAEDFSQRLRQAGARSGDVQFSLMWNNLNDLDLHCVDPNGEEIYYQHRGSASGGLLDVDMNASAPLTLRPVENIYWPARAAPSGLYRIYVNHYRNHGGPDPTHFVLRALVMGRLTNIAGSVTFGQSKLLVHQVVVRPGR
jgi:hypothetical protein